MDEAEHRMLRAKYLDWCSARLADRFLELTPEEIYELARPEPEVGSGSAGASAAVPAPQSAGYTDLVRRVTESLLSRIALPTFEVWREEYARSPDRYDSEMLGFWKGASDGGGSEP